MNINKIEFSYADETFEEWYYWIEGAEYRYLTYKTNSCPSGQTYVHVIGESRDLGPVMQFLPLDPMNPASGIRRFYKLLMLQ
jgi:hypothetical protein